MSKIESLTDALKEIVEARRVCRFMGQTKNIVTAKQFNAKVDGIDLALTKIAEGIRAGRKKSEAALHAVKDKPIMYLVTCNAGIRSDYDAIYDFVHWRDIDNAATYFCSHREKENWIGPACEYCPGHIAGKEKVLVPEQERRNEAIEKGASVARTGPTEEQLAEILKEGE